MLQSHRHVDVIVRPDLRFEWFRRYFEEQKLRNFLGSDSNAPESRSRIEELTAALDVAERKVAEHALLIAAALDQTETTRAQYEQANARAETLRRHLTAKEEQLNDLRKELKQRDERIAALEKQTAAPQSVSPASPVHATEGTDRLAALSLAMESLEDPGKRYKITQATTTIGRTATNDIAIDSNSVSRFHARIEIAADGVFLVDLESTNGCKVNGKRITRERIGDGDAISIGSEKFKFSAGAVADTEAYGMQETHVLLNDSAIFVPAPKPKPRASQ